MSMLHRRRSHIPRRCPAETVRSMADHSPRQGSASRTVPPRRASAFPRTVRARARDPADRVANGKRGENGQRDTFHVKSRFLTRSFTPCSPLRASGARAVRGTGPDPRPRAANPAASKRPQRRGRKPPSAGLPPAPLTPAARPPRSSGTPRGPRPGPGRGASRRGGRLTRATTAPRRPTAARWVDAAGHPLRRDEPPASAQAHEFPGTTRRRSRSSRSWRTVAPSAARAAPAEEAQFEERSRRARGASAEDAAIAALGPRRARCARDRGPPRAPRPAAGVASAPPPPPTAPRPAEETAAALRNERLHRAASRRGARGGGGRARVGALGPGAAGGSSGCGRRSARGRDAAAEGAPGGGAARRGPSRGGARGGPQRGRARAGGSGGGALGPARGEARRPPGGAVARCAS